MTADLNISVRFLRGEFHGRGDGGEPEWPPSPLRLFQALTNAAARLGAAGAAPSSVSAVHGGTAAGDATGATAGIGIAPQYAEALRWLETLPPPEILAVHAERTTGYQLYVPDNVGDLVAKKWSTGDTAATIAEFRAGKRVRPLRLTGDASVHYRWTADDDVALARHLAALTTATRAISAFGWGVDSVVADANTAPAGASSVGTVHGSAGTPAPAGTSAHVRWLPVATTGGNALRHPVAGTLDALVARHVAFLSRLPNDAATGEKFFRPVPPLATFRTVTYRPETDLASPPCAVFALRRPDDSAFATFDPQRRRLHLAGMLRHAAAVAADELGWNTEKKNAVGLGHAPADAPTDAPSPLPTVHGGTATGITGVTATRLIFIPLPSIEWRGDGNRVGAIRRVLVTTTGDAFPLADFDALVRALEGRDLRDEYYKNTVAFLRRDRSAENYAAGGAVSRYFAEAATWTTVTPLVLPGHDDRRGNRKKLRTLDAAAGKIRPEQKYAILRRLDAYIEHLLRRALRQSGIPENLADAAEIEWRGTGWLAGTGLASDYFPPDHLRRFRRLHVRLTWRDPAGNPLLLRGPFCLGAGRHFGLGLFAPAAVPPPPAPPATKRHFSSHSIA